MTEVFTMTFDCLCTIEMYFAAAKDRCRSICIYKTFDALIKIDNNQSIELFTSKVLRNYLHIKKSKSKIKNKRTKTKQKRQIKQQ